METFAKKTITKTLTDKELIVNIFVDCVKNKKIDLSEYNKKHCGKEGHWLEKQFGIKQNSRNAPDIYGYEMKQSSNKRKITFGDFSASEYIFSRKKPIINELNKCDLTLTRKEFMQFFGQKNPKKHNRLSWSGKCVPRCKNFNDFGQRIIVDEENNVFIIYDFSRDKRPIKNDFPEAIKKEDLIIAYWTKEKLGKHINDKFNKKGFFVCKKNHETDLYDKILFGKAFNYELFIKYLKEDKIILDSGMYNGNTRNYSSFRAKSSDFWELLFEETF